MLLIKAHQNSQASVSTHGYRQYYPSHLMQDIQKNVDDFVLEIFPPYKNIWHLIEDIIIKYTNMKNGVMIVDYKALFTYLNIESKLTNYEIYRIDKSIYQCIYEFYNHTDVSVGRDKLDYLVLKKGTKYCYTYNNNVYNIYEIMNGLKAYMFEHNEKVITATKNGAQIYDAFNNMLVDMFKPKKYVPTTFTSTIKNFFSTLFTSEQTKLTNICNEYIQSTNIQQIKSLLNDYEILSAYMLCVKKPLPSMNIYVNHICEIMFKDTVNNKNVNVENIIKILREKTDIYDSSTLDIANDVEKKNGEISDSNSTVDTVENNDNTLDNKTDGVVATPTKNSNKLLYGSICLILIAATITGIIVYNRKTINIHEDIEFATEKESYIYNEIEV